MLDLSSLNSVDYIIIAVLFISGVMATFRGLIREVMGLAGWLIALIAAQFAQPTVSEYTSDFINNDALNAVIGFLAPFVGAAIVWFVIANITAPSLKKASIGGLDRPLGFLFGGIRGAIIVTMIYMSALALLEGEEHLPGEVHASTSIVPMRIIGATLADFAPDSIRDSLNIPDQDFNDLLGGDDEILEGAQELQEDLQDNLLPDEQIEELYGN